MIINLDLNDDKYQGFGFGTHLDYYPLKKEKINPFVGLGVSRNVGRAYSFDRVTDKITNFSIDDANYITPFVGLRYDGLMEDGQRHSSLGMFLKIGYKTSFNSNPDTHYVSGPEDNAKLNDINNYIKNGIIASFGIIISWSK